ncbi:hypothetical protein PEBR_41877 [Penicillium brasilianum]|uniref:Zn(2)-C6 fungal-type domain-containing protein n=1 Tax=Penicillium brasilianum TaxID=104259 RepID=A0A1S9R9V2_PENBI|nr:hypothetical protein PEBR_41877 [Penicillium brasilianum]
MPEPLLQTQESLGGFDQHGVRSTEGAGACIACQASSARCVVIDEPPCHRCTRQGLECVFNESATLKPRTRTRQRNPLKCRTCVLQHSKCELVDGRRPCKICLAGGRECVPQGPWEPKTAEASVPQESVDATDTTGNVSQKTNGPSATATATPAPCLSCRAQKAQCKIIDQPPCTECRRQNHECRFEEKQPRQERIAHTRNLMGCMPCKTAHSRCEMIDGRPPCTRCRRIGRSCVPKTHDESAKTSRPKRAVNNPSKRKDIPPRTTDATATATATPAARTSCQAPKAQCEIVDQPPYTKRRRGNHESMFEKEVDVPKKGVSCLRCSPSERCIMGNGPPCNRCHAKRQTCVPRDLEGDNLEGDIPAQSSLPESTTADTAEICVACQTRQARCEVISKPPCTECRKKHRKCSLLSLLLPSLDPFLLISEISDLTSLPSSSRLSRRHSRRDSSDTDTSDIDSSRSNSLSVKWEMSQSPMLLDRLQAFGYHENIAPSGHAIDGVSVATQPTLVPRTELATMQPSASKPESSQHDENRAAIDHGVSGLSDTTRPTQLPSPEPATTQPTALAPDISETNENIDSILNAASATQQTQYSRMKSPTIPSAASGFEPFLSTNLGLHASEFGQTIVSRLSQPSEEVLDLWWDNCNFVRDGWLTAQEAVSYLDL